MKLLRPVSRWIARKPHSQPDWLEGLELTQEDIDHDLMLSEKEADAPTPKLPAVTWIPEETHA